MLNFGCDLIVAVSLPYMYRSCSVGRLQNFFFLVGNELFQPPSHWLNITNSFRCSFAILIENLLTDTVTLVQTFGARTQLMECKTHFLHISLVRRNFCLKNFFPETATSVCLLPWSLQSSSLGSSAIYYQQSHYETLYLE